MAVAEADKVRLPFEPPPPHEDLRMRVLIVDDHPLILEGLSNVLGELDAAVEVVTASNATDALRRLADPERFSLALLDLMLPGSDGMSLLEQMRAAHQDVPVVVLSGQDSRDNVNRAIDAGAMGFISKRSPTRVLVSALRLVLVGGVYVPPEAFVGAKVRSPLSQDAPARTVGRDAVVAGLTERQLEVLSFLVQGKPNKVISRELDLQESTVKTHIAAIFRALNVSNRTEAVFELSRLGIQLPLRPGATPTRVAKT
jgi:DNA-binding NarL/FixJ family response regulator